MGKERLRMKTVILCGGRGMRLSELTHDIPKPLALIGDKPIVWHIMKTYSHYGFNEFILALGYLGNKIKKYFENYEDGSVEKIGKNKIRLKFNSEEWIIEFADTGEKTNTGGRVKKIQNLIKEEEFMCTYGDGLSNVNLKKLAESHKAKGKIGTITVVNPLSQFGILKIDKGAITEFKEKPRLDHWINGGFFVFNKKIFNYLNNDSVLEKEPFEKLAKKKELNAFKHEGFWECMDTFKDNTELNDLWKNGKAEWKLW